METKNPVQAKSYGFRIWYKFKQHRLAKIGAVFVIFFSLISIFAPFFSPHDYTKPYLSKAFYPPQRIHFVDKNGTFHLRPFVYELQQELDPRTWNRVFEEDTSKKYSIYFFVKDWEYELLGIKGDIHLFGIDSETGLNFLGTDTQGRDLLSRIFYGGRISLTIALFGALISTIFGSLIGAASGYFGGKIDMVVQRILELLVSFPKLPLWMALSIAIPISWPSTRIAFGVIIIFALLGWMPLAREVRGKVLSCKEEAYVLATKAMGGSDFYVILKHIIPNVSSHIIVVMTVTIPRLILAESGLSFLGLGIQPPLVSWGVLLRSASSFDTLAGNYWLLFPGFAILFTVLGFNFLGDGLRDAIDPSVI